MNPETLRCRILDYTKREMYQHGADGLTMDDIARGMKMSKRTLYKLFPSKTSLFRVCLSDFANGIRSRIQQKQIRMDSSCMEALFITVDGYLTLLHSLGKKLLMDIAADREYRAAFEREEAFWLQQLIDVFEKLEDIADVASMSPEDRERYDNSVKVYRDYLVTMDAAEQKGAQETQSRLHISEPTIP